MVYDLTPEERQKYVTSRGKTIVTACPGSGKTTSIVYKLKQVCQEIESQNKHMGVLCLSFTNKAVDEIRGAYKNMHGTDLRYPHEVSTIDSFITQNIVMPYWYLCKFCKVSPIIVNESDVLHDLLWFHYKDKSGKLQEACRIGNYGKTPRYIAPEKVNIHAGKFYYETNELDAQYTQYAKDIVSFRLSKGYLTSSDAMFVALDVLSNFPQIAESLIIRYPYIVVDEAQDTSDDQFSLFSKLIEVGLKNLEFVGDVNQSIYEWRFANPARLEMLCSKEGWQHIPFNNNRRSVQNIIDLYSKLVPLPKRLPIVSTGVDDKALPVVVYRYDNRNSQDILKDFGRICRENNLNERLVLTRGRNLGKLLSGAKEKPDYWKSPIPRMIINAYVDFKSGFISKAVQQIAYVWSMLLFSENDYDGKRNFIREKVESPVESTYLINMFFEMPNLNETFFTWTTKMQLFIKDKFGLKELPNFDVYKYKKAFDIKQMANKSLSLYFGTDATEQKSGQIVQTIHSSKGASTDAALIFLSSDNRGGNISMNLFVNTTIMSEKHRMLYVACSRARQFLGLAVPMDFPEKQIKMILNDVKYEIRTPVFKEGLF